MERAVLLAAKAAELTESLKDWALENLGPGEQLLVSLRVQNVPLVSVDPDDLTQIENQLLDMELMEFFTLERLRQLQYTKSSGARTHSGLLNVARELRFKNVGKVPTLRDLLTMTVEEVKKAGLMGIKSLHLVQDVLNQEGFALRDPEGILEKTP